MNPIYWLQYKGKDKQYQTVVSKNGKRTRARRPMVFSSRRYLNRTITRACIVAVGDKVQIRVTEPVFEKNKKKLIQRFRHKWITALIHKIHNTKTSGLLVQVKYYQWLRVFNKRTKQSKFRDVKKYKYVDLNAVKSKYVMNNQYVLSRRHLKLTSFPVRNLNSNQIKQGQTVLFYHVKNHQWLLTKTVSPVLPGV